MGIYDRILVPTDGSDGVARAVCHAAALAASHGATLHAVYVVSTGAYAGLPTETNWEGVDEMLRADAEAALADVAGLAADYGVDCETRVLEGRPHREIVEYAERTGCDLVVMGTHGRGGIDRLLLGSVAERVVRAARVPVMTVRVGDPDEAPAAADVGDAGGAADSRDDRRETEDAGPGTGTGSSGSGSA
jgi:nucleotide-binding universal stress UspA family protein